VGVAQVSEITDEKLIRMMVGRVVDTLYPSTAAIPGKPILRVSGLTRKGVLHDISFELRRGEILGFAGLVGAGRTEMSRCIFGADRHDSGTIELEGRPLTVHSPRDAVRAGIGYVPEDRKLQGLILEMTVRNNITLSVLHRLARGGLVSWRDADELATDFVKRLQVRPPQLDLKASQMSGGNQQKIVLAKWLALKPKVLILDEPTRGVDVGAKAEVHALIARLVQEDIGIILVSSELPEVLNMSHRILVMAEGEIVGELSREDATQERVLELASMKSQARVAAIRPEAQR
jgi:ABC-type sugar transport system ATPase subunit